MPRLREGPGDATLVRDAKDDAGLPGEDAFTHSSSKGHPQLNCHAEKNALLAREDVFKGRQLREI